MQTSISLPSFLRLFYVFSTSFGYKGKDEVVQFGRETQRPSDSDTAAEKNDRAEYAAEPYIGDRQEMFPQGVENEQDDYQEYAEEGFTVGDRHAAGKTQDKQCQCEISRIGDEVAEGCAIHSIDRNEIVVEQGRDYCQEERKEERKYIEARVTERGEANGESGNNDLVDTISTTFFATA